MTRDEKAYVKHAQDMGYSVENLQTKTVTKSLWPKPQFYQVITGTWVRTAPKNKIGWFHTRSIKCGRHYF